MLYGTLHLIDVIIWTPTYILTYTYSTSLAVVLVEYQHMINLIEPKLILCDADVADEVRQGLNLLGSNTEIITFQVN